MLLESTGGSSGTPEFSLEGLVMVLDEILVGDIERCQPCGDNHSLGAILLLLLEGTSVE